METLNKVLHNILDQQNNFSTDELKIAIDTQMIQVLQIICSNNDTEIFNSLAALDLFLIVQSNGNIDTIDLSNEEISFRWRSQKENIRRQALKLFNKNFKIIKNKKIWKH